MKWKGEKSFLDNIFGKTDQMSQYMLRVRNNYPKIYEILGSVSMIFFYFFTLVSMVQLWLKAWASSYT